LITVTNTSYINAESVCELLHKIAVLEEKNKVTLVLDNARYQRCKLVDELASSLAIEVLYLPSYSPNLNLIERLWKFVKKECLNGKYYDTFERFRASIEECLAQLPTKHRHAMDSLMTCNFQLFNETAVATA
jgi:transposase